MPARLLAAATLALAVAAPAAASVVTFNTDVVTGGAAFDAAIDDMGGRCDHQVLQYLIDGRARWEMPEFTISSTNGIPRFVFKDYADLRANGRVGAMSGWSLLISANAPAAEWGLTFDFRSPINAFGIEVGDWATCCYGSGLSVAFDDDPPIQLAYARGPQDNPGYRRYGAFTNFVGAIDTSERYHRVTFYGTGVGEVLLAGGTVSYALLPVDGEPARAPEPASWTLALGGVLALGALRRGRRR